MSMEFFAVVLLSAPLILFLPFSLIILANMANTIERQKAENLQKLRSIAEQLKLARKKPD